MSTRSYISKLNADGTSKTIYCHYDGHIKNVGKRLYFSYNNSELVDKLVDLGDISVLGNTVEETNSYYINGEDWDIVKPKEFKTEKELMQFLHDAIKDFVVGYVYIFKEVDNRWHVITRDGNGLLRNLSIFFK